VRLSQLRIENLRAFQTLELALAPGWNAFTGPNGAGKTTLLEAAFLLSHARSFRGGSRDALLRRGADGFTVYGRIERETGRSTGLGLSRRAGVLDARVDGEPVAVADLLRNVAVACFEPGSHELLSGGSEGRRRFLDWGVFHVEHEFLRVWRIFQRALKQRNALLRQDSTGSSLAPWDAELARAGAELSAMRHRYVATLAGSVIATLHDVLPELGAASFVLSGGWADEGEAFAQLESARDDDLRRGFTTRGPHRADWTLSFERAPRREHLSRGQEKLGALGCILGQARVFAAQRGEWPIVCIDDLASELDAPHQEKLLRALCRVDAQILLTGTHEPSALAALPIAVARFHVEPGSVRALL
jgi:DNA replication and repair protein RecF